MIDAAFDIYASEYIREQLGISPELFSQFTPHLTIHRGNGYYALHYGASINNENYEVTIPMPLRGGTNNLMHVATELAWGIDKIVEELKAKLVLNKCEALG